MTRKSLKKMIGNGTASTSGRTRLPVAKASPTLGAILTSHFQGGAKVRTNQLATGYVADPNQAGALKALHDQQALILDRVRGVAFGHNSGLYLHGRPGTSKTFLVRTWLTERSIRHDYHQGHITTRGLFDKIRDNPHSVIVLDDVSQLFKEPVGLQILLAALGTPPDGSRVRRVAYKTAYCEEVVDFSGGIIAISNLPLKGHNSEVRDALSDRVHVYHFDPTNEQVEAAIYDLAESSPRGVDWGHAIVVAGFVIDECRRQGARISIRLYLDKALADFIQWREGNTQSHWHDLVRSSVSQQTIPHEHELRDLSRKDTKEAEQRLVLSICNDFSDRNERCLAWFAQTQKSEKAFYRRFRELRLAGLLPEDPRSTACKASAPARPAGGRRKPLPK